MALKIINMDDANKRKQLVTELRTLVGASCKQFVNMLDAFFHDGTVYIALEYMDGGSIDNIQKKIGVRMPEASLAFMLREMLVGLSVLHEERKQIHRDIKPGNLLFNSQGDVKLGDFGISKTLEASLLGGGKQQASTYVGTSLYMSPERLQGQNYSYTSDIFVCGDYGSRTCHREVSLRHHGWTLCTHGTSIGVPSSRPTSWGLFTGFL